MAERHKSSVDAKVSSKSSENCDRRRGDKQTDTQMW